MIPNCLCEAMKKRITIKKTKQSKDNMRQAYSKHCVICLCVCVYACVILSLVLLTYDRLWAHHTSEVPRDLITLRLWSGS